MALSPYFPGVTRVRNRSRPVSDNRSLDTRVGVGDDHSRPGDDGPRSVTDRPFEGCSRALCMTGNRKA